ncbi:MAG: HAMP domain-containing histidine kinase [Lachnospiraceae bacterium]|nr:HAMP domain-containing histidine kinase [Lachnospiraceae bacterium]
MRNRSIRFKLVLWGTIALLVLAGVTLAAVLGASSLVLRGNIRDFLISTVEENVDNIDYVTEPGDTRINYYIEYDGGFLEIDLDYMEEVNDVRTGLYTSDGKLLYGENSLAQLTSEIPFDQSRTWSIKSEGIRYDIYDRKVNISSPSGEPLWIRGIVPETRSTAQLNKILNFSLILIPISIILAVIVQYLLADRLLSPIRKIEETAAQISEGNDLGQRIDTGKNNDEVGRLAKVFNHMLDRLEKSFENERRFTSDASHELRTPMAVILAQTEYTLEKDRTPEEYKEALEVIQGQACRMNTLVNDMLDYTRMDQSAERYPFEDTDLSEIVSEVSEDLKLLGTKGITLSSEIATDVHVLGNSLLLSRLVANLINNAYKYGNENGHIWVSLGKENGQAVLSVRDDGIGIDPSEQALIFERFYRSDSSRSEKGTGLGLSMVKKIAELHGAEIILDSMPGKGSNFKIIF